MIALYTKTWSYNFTLPYRYSKYITPYKSPHTKIYSMNCIDFCVCYVEEISIVLIQSYSNILDYFYISI